MTQRRQLVALAVVVLAALIGSFAYVAHARDRQRAAAAAPPGAAVTADLATVVAGPHLIFRSTVPGQGYGRVAAVPLDRPDGPRALTPATCDRVHATRGQAICLFAKPAMVTSYHATLLRADWSPWRELPLTGIPSRTRLSRDGTLSATTTFVYGHSYASPGQFSTQTLVSRVAGGRSDDLEKFALYVNGRAVTARDRNVWGVTFAGGDRFYATAASGKKTWLVEGSLSGRRLTALREDAECPSLSPDGTRVAVKTRDGLPPGQWRLAVHDLRTGVSTRLSETRSVDDQVEWLDDNRVLYGLSRAGAGAASTDVWTAAADGSGSPALFVRDAWSPAVVR